MFKPLAGLKRLADLDEVRHQEAHRTDFLVDHDSGLVETERITGFVA